MWKVSAPVFAFYDNLMTHDNMQFFLVSANSYIRNAFKELEKDGIKVYMPDLKLCTDNAAMIASAGYYNFIAGKRDTLDLNAIPNLKL